MSDSLETLLDELRPVFADAADFARARRQWLAGLLNLGRHTVTGALSTAGRQHCSWTADYRLLQRLPTEAVFERLRLKTLESLEPDRPWVVALDDSITRKTGRRIPGCGWRKDPLGPPFNVNFVWGQRVLQFSAAIPAKDGSARLIPVDWQEAPLPCKPPRRCAPEAQAAYVEARRQANINRVATTRMARLRESTQRPIHFVGDGRFTNRTVLLGLPPNSVLIGRVRKDTKLYATCTPRPGANGRPRRYGPVLPTPEQLRLDAATPWTHLGAFAAGQRHQFKIKSLGPVMARIAGVDHPVRIVVIAPLGYRLRQGGKLLYRQPAYLLCTDPALPLADLLQHYLWRWDIEVNFKEEKTLLGVSQAQVRVPETVARQPQGAVAAYALLLLAALRSYGHDRLPPGVPLARWRRRQPLQRPTTGLLLNQLRLELWARCLRPEALSHFCSTSTPHHNPDKPPLDHDLDLASAVFYSHN